MRNRLVCANRSEAKKDVISLDGLAKKDRDQKPRFIEKIRRDKNGEILAYVLKRNPEYRKKEIVDEI